jgi:hypothetical protein
MVVGRNHATFSTSRHDLVLAERPRTDVADAPNGTPLVAGTVSLGTVFDHGKVMLTSQGHDRVHVTRPTCQMHADHCSSASGEHPSHRIGGKVLAVTVNIRKNRRRTCRDDAGNRSQKSTSSHDDLITRPDTQRLECKIKSDSTVSKRNRILTLCPSGELVLELAPLVSSPVVHLPGAQNLADRSDLVLGKMRPRGELDDTISLSGLLGTPSH